jgi:hypothetical protein
LSRRRACCALSPALAVPRTAPAAVLPAPHCTAAACRARARPTGVCDIHLPGRVLPPSSAVVPCLSACVLAGVRPRHAPLAPHAQPRARADAPRRRRRRCRRLTCSCPQFVVGSALGQVQELIKDPTGVCVCGTVCVCVWLCVRGAVCVALCAWLCARVCMAVCVWLCVGGEETPTRACWCALCWWWCMACD